MFDQNDSGVTDIKYRPMAGDDIRDTIRTALKLAKKYTCTVHFSFNGVDLDVREFEEEEKLFKEYKWEANRQDWPRKYPEEKDERAEGTM